MLIAVTVLSLAAVTGCGSDDNRNDNKNTGNQIDNSSSNAGSGLSQGGPGGDADVNSGEN